MGKPRRFSANFVKQQRAHLATYRNHARQYIRRPNKNQPISQQSYMVLSKYLQQLQLISKPEVGQNLLAIHPRCGHIHHGAILTIDSDSIIVKFSSNELGVHKIPDCDISKWCFLTF